jgi:uncharacterized protein
LDFETAYIGTRDECRSFLASSKCFYVYVLCRPDGRPFYVGKGKGLRVFEHENEARRENNWKSNAHKLNVIRSIWRSTNSIIYAVHSIHTSEDEAYLAEAKLISKWKRIHEGGLLTSLAAGGGEVSDRSPISLQKHRATLSGIPENNPERAVINEFVLAIAPMNSVNIKPASQFTPRLSIPHSKARTPTLRQAAALVAAAAAKGVSMNFDCIVPRKIEVAGVCAFIEDGVSSDILKSGMATLVESIRAEDEQFALTESQALLACGIVGIEKCRIIGLLN